MTAPHSALPAPDAANPIAADLEEVEQVLSRELRSRYPTVTPVVDHVRHYRGKRLRPVLLLLAARASGKITAAHPIFGAVVEMIHTATLVHDDILDRASVRRHVATVNALWNVPNAVLLGDYLFTHAFYLASTLDDIRACRLIGSATNRVCEGELCQGLERGNLELSEEGYYDIIDGKTAELTSCCCHLGAHIQWRVALRWYRPWLALADTSDYLSRSPTISSTSLATSVVSANHWGPISSSRR